MANVETRRDENTFLGSWCNIRTHPFYERRLDHESILSRSGLWAKILGEEPLFSCMGLSFEERFGNVAVLATVASSRNSEDALRECHGSVKDNRTIGCEGPPSFSCVL